MFFHFKITLRNLRRGGVFSAINIIGLATGMAVAGFIALWIYGAVTFDAYHTHAKDTYLVTYTMKSFVAKVSSVKTGSLKQVQMRIFLAY